MFSFASWVKKSYIVLNRRHFFSFDKLLPREGVNYMIVIRAKTTENMTPFRRQKKVAVSMYCRLK